MSFGALSPNAVRALSRGAKLAECYMSTGEGSMSPYHVEGGGDILYQIGPAKFGCRTDDGRFDDEKAAAIIALPQVKMIEIKLAQGAKPGKGGLLPKEKITAEIAAIRGIPMGVDCHSPNRFEEFDDAPSLLDFVARVRKLTGKPIGLKMVVGASLEIDALCAEMRRRGDGPDFIAVDGKEGGSGAAPLALADYVGLPLVDALTIVDNALRREGLRDEVTVMASGQDRDWRRGRNAYRARCGHRAHRARIPVFARLHPGAPVPHEYLPDGRHHAEPVASVRTQPRRQERPCFQLCAGARARSADDHARLWPRPPEPAHPRTCRRERLTGRQKTAGGAFPVP